MKLKLSLLFLSMLILFSIFGCKSEENYWQDAQASNSTEAYEEFIKRYPESPRAEEAKMKVIEMHYHEAVSNNTIEAYEEFIKKHPESVQAQDVRKKLEEMHAPPYGVIISLPEEAKDIIAANIEVNLTINGTTLSPLAIGYDPEHVLKTEKMLGTTKEAVADISQYVVSGKNIIHFLVKVLEFEPKEISFPKEAEGLRGFRTNCLDIKLFQKLEIINKQTVTWTIIDMGGWGPTAIEPEEFDFEFESPQR